MGGGGGGWRWAWAGEKASTKAQVSDYPVFFAMLRMFSELNITTKKVLAGDLGVKPKNIAHHNPLEDVVYSQAAPGCHKLASSPLS